MIMEPEVQIIGILLLIVVPFELMSNNYTQNELYFFK